MRDVTVVVDPGHGGSDTGTVYEPLVKPGAVYKECAIVMPLSYHLAGYLSGYSGDDVRYKVVLTRASDKRISITRRVLTANICRADAFISCHVSDMTGEVDPDKVSGASVLYFRRSDASFALADHVLAEMLNTGLVKRFSDGLIPSGIDVLRRTKMPAVVVQLGFIRNYQDLGVITDEDCQAKLAYAIFKGLHCWLTERDEE